MTVYVFLGPSLKVEDAQQVLDAVYLPPVSQGDVYRVAKLNPTAIGIVDGFFDQVPAVWHKEILWAMQQGIHVFGSSSMGALRAAELAAFGMQGIGEIFAAYHDGTLEDDDEVAIAHASGEEGYQPLSTALVDMRATLDKALRESVIDQATHDQLLSTAKAMSYPKRHYATVIQAVRNNGGDGTILDAFKAWLPDNKVEQKREDALALLRELREFSKAPPLPLETDYTFQYTTMWRMLVQGAGMLRVQDDHAQQVRMDWLLDEIRLKPEYYYHISRLTLLQLCATHIAELEQWQHDPATKARMLETFKAQFRLDSETFPAWLVENDLSEDEFLRQFEDYVQINQLENRWADSVQDAIPDVLRISGNYPKIMSRAGKKNRLLSEHYPQLPTVEQLGLTDAALYRWYFTERLKQPGVPPNLTDFARQAGFRDEATFKRALIREYCYQQLR